MPTMSLVRLRGPGGIGALAVEQGDIPGPGPGEAVVRVHAAAITRDELDWPADRLPAIPSYELSGTVEALAPDTADLAVGDAVYALTPFDADGVAAEYAAVPTRLLAPKPRTLTHVEAAALPLAGLTAWQGLFAHGRLAEGERVLIHGAAGGVGHLAVQLARWRGAYVIGTATGAGVQRAREFGAHEVIDRASARFEEAAGTVDLVFDTVGGEALARSAAVLRQGGRIVCVAEEPPPAVAEAAETVYFVVEPSRGQLAELARLADAGVIRPAIDSVFPLARARQAFQRVMMGGKSGKVVLDVADGQPAASG